MEYYVYKDGQNLGPLSEQDMVLGLSTGRFRSDDLACRVGAAEWQELDVLFPNDAYGRPASPSPAAPPRSNQPYQPAYQPQPIHYQSSSHLSASSDVTKLMYFEANKKSAGLAYVLLIFLGGFGAHRFYLGRPGSAVAQIALWWGSLILTTVLIGFLTIWIAPLWWFIDLFLIPQMVNVHNNSLLARTAQM